MKIVLMSRLFPPNYTGGTEIATMKLARALSKNKKNYVFVITSAQSELKTLRESYNIIPTFNPFPNNYLLSIFFYTLFSSFILWKIKPDIIHCQGTPSAMGALLSRKNYIVHCRGSDINHTFWIKSLRNKLVLKKSKKVLVLSRTMKQKIKEEYKLSSTIIPNGVDSVRYFNSRRELRRKYGIMPKEKVILFVGRLEKVKNVDDLIEAFAILGQKIKNLRLFIVGDGSEKERLNELVVKKNLEKRVLFFNHQIQDIVFELMKSSDIFALTSSNEGMSNALLEAMNYGLPIVSSNVGAAKDIIKKGENGFLIKAREHSSLQKSLFKLLSDNQLRAKISKKNKEKMRLFRWNRIAKEILTLYLKLIKHNEI